jgi:hypothetical protein
MSNYHVTKRKGEVEWTVVKENAERVSAKAVKQASAEQIAKQLAANSGGGEVRIHRPDGRIRDSDTVAPGRESPVRDKKH